MKQLETEVTHFQDWVHAYPVPEEERSPEWERGYENWPALWKAFSAFVATVACHEWGESTTEKVVFAIAHDTDQLGLFGR